MTTQLTKEMTLFDAIYSRRSIRQFTPERLSKDVIDALLAAAVRAPTALHEEQWAFVVMQGKAKLQQLSKQVSNHIAVELRPHLDASVSGEPHGNDAFNLFHDADTLILICAQPMGPFVAADCWLAAENLMLAACAMGLGSCVIGSAVEGLNTPAIKRMLNIPEEIAIVAPIVVGKPVSIPPLSGRREPLILSWHVDMPV